MHATSDTSPNVEQPGPWSRGLLKCVDALIAVLILILPFVMGGREAWGHWLLITAAGSLGCCWCAYAAVSGTRYRISWLEVFFIAGLSIAWFQLQPQSAEQLAKFSGEYQRLLPHWGETQQAAGEQAAGEQAAWKTISFTPAETRHGIRVLLAYCLIALVFFQRVKTEQDCQQALRSVAVSGVLMAVFGLLQWASSNGKFFWIYEHPFTDPTEHLKAAFTNRNHFAQFLALSMGPLLWWLVTLIRRALVADDSATKTTSESSLSSRLRRKHAKKSGSQGTAFSLATSDSTRMLTIPILVLVVCVAIVGLSVLLSLSRGGMIATTAAVVITGTGMWRGFHLPGTMAALLLGTSVIVFSGLAFFDQDQVQTRIEELISGDADRVDAGGARRAVWAADAKVIEHFPLLGTGIGSHRDVYPLYMDNYADFATFEMTHAESSYIHLALEAGLVGCGLLVAALLWFLSRLAWGYFTQKLYEQRSLIIAVAASAVAALLHAVTDFIWYVPAIVVTSLMLVAIGLNSVSGHATSPNSSQGIPLPRIAWLAMAILCAVTAGWFQSDLFARVDAEKHWYASLNIKFHKPLDDDGFGDLKPGDTIVLDDEPVSLDDETTPELTPEQRRNQRLAEIKYLKTRIQHLRQCIHARPDQHRPQIAMAENLIRLFDLLQNESTNPLPLNMVRDAAISAEFPTVDELHRWLDSACENRIQLIYVADELSRQALSHCPIQGYGYLNLLETSFVNTVDQQTADDLLQQALLVRGHDPRVTYIAGREALMASDQKTAFRYWNSVFHSSEHFRLNILTMLAPQVPAGFFVQQFHPNGEELVDLLRVYEALERPEESSLLRRKLCQVLPEESPSVKDEDERLRLLLLASQFAMELEDHPLAAQILEDTLKVFPTAYDAHHRLAVTLYEMERYQESLVHLEWCHEWDPGSEWVPELIRSARARVTEILEAKAAQESGIQRAAWQRPSRAVVPAIRR